ncbi:hypothetical protein J2T13_003743 [Paenibacillus sp. DS2015]
MENPILFVAVVLFIGLVGYYIKKMVYIDENFVNGFNKITTVIINSLVSFLIIFVGFSNVYSIYSLTDSAEYTSHFNAVFHSMALVHMGESILVDITNQYGLYPHILEPIFKVIGLNVFSFTLIMSMLVSLSLYFLYKVLDKLITNKIYSLLAFSFVLFYGYVHFKIVNPDSYFQYYPIRTLFPTLLMYYSLKYFESKSYFKYYLFTFISSIALLWNLDSGLIVFITWILVQLFDEALNWKGWILFAKNCFKHLVVSIGALISILLIFTLYIYLRSGTIPNLIEFFNYQIYFYGYGFFMLPMKMIHPWNLVALIYILGLLFSLNAVVRKENTLLVRVIFLLSILGVGLFSYYQGRSHDNVLTLVWYPALMLLVLYIYMLYCKVQKKIVEGESRNWMQQIVLLSLILCTVSSLFALAKSSTTIYQLIEERWSSTFEKGDSPIISGADFIRENTTEGEETLILSYHSGVDYLYSKTIPVIDVPGMSEMFLNNEYNKINEEIVNSSLQKVFVDRNFISNTQLNFKSNAKILTLLYENFRIVDRSDADNVLMFSRRSNNSQESNLTLLPNLQSNQHYLIQDSIFVVESLSNRFVGIKENLPPVILSQEFSIEVTLKPNRIQNQYSAVIGNHPGVGFQGFVIQQENENQNVYTFTYGNGIQWSAPSKFPLEAGEWNYLTVVFNKGAIKIYNNSELISATIGSTLDHIENSKMPLSIGNWISMDRGFNGDISEFKISDIVLTDQDILDNWKAMKAQLPK